MLSFREFTVKILVLVTANSAYAAAELRTTDFDILVSNRSEIYLFKQNGVGIHRYTTDTLTILDADHHPGKNLLIWIDYESSAILSQKFIANGTERYVMIFKKNRTWRPVALAVDHTSDKIYIVDELGRTVQIFDLDGKHHSIVMSLTHPTDIKLDLYEGFMFVLDGLNIVRASLDGSSPVIIVLNDVSPTNGIYVDLMDKSIYWKKNKKFQIVTSDYSGSNVTIVADDEDFYRHQWSKFAVLNNTVLWANELADFKRFHRCYYRYGNPAPAVKILRPNVSYSAGSNPCETDNGGCEHMCVLKSRSNDTADRYSCLCDVGYELAEDLKRCKTVNKFLLYTLRNNLKSLVIENHGNHEPFEPIATERHDVTFGDFDYDHTDDRVYYVLKSPASGYGSLFRTHLNDSSHPEPIRRDTFEYYQSIAIDWMTGNLYHVDSVEGTINVLSTRRESSKLTLIRKLLWPEDIAVHPTKGYICFLQVNQISKETVFSRARMDGSNLTVFDNVVLKNRCSFVIDREQDRIYWFRIKDKVVRYSDLDMNDVKTLRVATNPYFISVYKAWVYVGSATGEGVWRYDKRTGEKRDLVLGDTLNEVRNVKIFDAESRRVVKGHPCLVNNGGCRDFCFGYPLSNRSWTKVCADSNF